MTPRPISILLIEDNPADANFVEEMLDQTPYFIQDVVWVTRLRQGIQQLQSALIDIILLDLSLPDSHGLESIITLQAFNQLIPIVVLSGNRDEQTAIKAVNHGAQDYLLKDSVSSHTLPRAIHYAIERKRIQNEHEMLIKELKTALAEIKTLRGLIPICASCKKVKDDTGYWNQIEVYVSEHSEADFSHGVCPDCALKLYPEYYP